MLSSPLYFEPFLRPMVWGGRRLETLGKMLPGAETYGESWEVSDHPLHRSVVAEGPRAGQSIRWLMDTEREALLGHAAGQHAIFPWLWKFLDAQDWLSVQVHPVAELVKKLRLAEGPKNEAWFVLDAQPGSLIYAGLRPGIGPDPLRAALNRGTVAECLHRFTPRPGDFVYFPAGTVHAVGGGVLLAEIQQTSDATFRLFDWNRRDAQGKLRPLHVEEAITAIHWDQGPVEPVNVANDAMQKFPRPLVRCPFFNLDYVRETAAFSLGGLGKLQTLAVFSGRGRWPDGQQLLPGHVWLLPASLPALSCEPEPMLAGMLATLP